MTRVRVELQDGHDEGLYGCAEGMAAELFNVGDAFEGLHGGSPFDGHKKARDVAGTRGEPGGAQSGMVREINRA